MGVKDNLFFRANAKVESLFGRELITNNIIAIFELVKNSYDAGSKNVHIVFEDLNKIDDLNDMKQALTNIDSRIKIIDDGKGMTFNEIDLYWMELGTPYKEINNELDVRVREKLLEKVIKRKVNGEKGVGRFGVDKIGSKLILESKTKKASSKTRVLFDWDMFDDRSKLIGDIPCFAEEIDVDLTEDSGTSLTIKGLRDNWKFSDVEKLEKELKKFISPNKFEDDDFHISITLLDKHKGKKVIEIENDTFDYLGTFIEAEIDTDGYMEYSIYSEGMKDIFEEFMYENRSTFGRLRLVIYYLNRGDKVRFTNKMGIRTSDYGNIRVYKDNFRVMPYGDSHNDWLEIDKKHAQGMFRTFGTRDLVGYVQMSHHEDWNNNLLKEATDRVGLIEDVEAFQELKVFIWSCIEVLETFVFTKLRNSSKKIVKELDDETHELRIETTEVFNEIKELIQDSELGITKKQEINRILNKNVKKIANSIDQIEDTTHRIENRIKVYNQITSKESLLIELMHQIRNKVVVITSQIDFLAEELGRSKNVEVSIIRRALKSIEKMVDGSLNRVNTSKLEKKNSSIKSLIDELYFDHIALLNERNIQYEAFIPDDYTINMSVESIKVNVFENFYSNSIKALSGRENKKIRIECVKVDNHLQIIFSDTGKGIPEDSRSRVFTLWDSKSGGTGIGLAAAKEAIEEHGGTISLIEGSYMGYRTSFLVKIPL